MNVCLHLHETVSRSCLTALHTARIDPDFDYTQRGGEAIALGLLTLCIIPCAGLATRYLVKIRKRLRQSMNSEGLNTLSAYAFGTGGLLCVVQILVSQVRVCCQKRAS